MSETSLRAYIREIDNLIEQEKLDEAIAHCRHILQSYPKHIECYRLLGKAYLEAKRFGDAADIFQRVLSAVPDDFVSHIGMSLVREDEGNTDAAIWHMERAYETNPANPAIQQELKRLIGQRDGFEPHKVRLTRGALARMYAHGELYPQAIAELRSALREDPDRPDLQVLLAQMYWQTDQRKEAAAVSGDVLKKLPYCLPATRITAAVLQARGKAEEAAAYHRRLAQLEPYLAYSEVPMIESTRIDSDSIVLDRLSWQPGEPLPATEAGPADWATSLGLEPDEGEGPGTGPLPSWLEEVEPGEGFGEAPSEAPAEPAHPTPTEPPDEAPAPTLEEAPTQQMEVPAEPPEEEAEPAAELPDWMADAGWQESTGEVEEQPVSFSSEELAALEGGEPPTEVPPAEEDTGELEPAEIPGWLQGMAPAAEEHGEEGDEELEALLRSGAAPPAEEADPVAETAVEAEPPTPEAEPEGVTEGEGSDVPSWLDEGEPGATSTIMTWLGDRDEEEEPAEAPEAAEEQDWLPDVELGAEEPAPTEPEEEAVPGWLSGVAEAAAGAGEAEEEELARLRRQAAEEPAEEEPSEAAPAEEVPDWIQSITGEETEAPAPETAPQEELEETFAWEAEMEAAEQDTVPQPPAAEEEPTAAPETATPDWLSGFGEPEETIPGEPAGEVEAEFEEDWLAGLGEEAEPTEGPSWLEQLGEAEEAPEAAPSEPAEAVPGWMAGLEEEPAAEAEVEDIASGWLDDLSDTLAETPAEPEVTEEAPAEEEAPEWLATLGGEAEREEAMAAEGGMAAEEDLSWLDNLEAEEAPTEVPSGIEEEVPTPAAEGAEPTAEAAELESFDEDEVFKWLDQMAAEAEQEGTQLPAAEAPGGAAAEEAAELSDEVPPESLEEGLDWLERLADTRGIDADVSIETAAEPPSEPAAAAEPSEPAPEMIQRPQEPAEVEEPTADLPWHEAGPPEEPEETVIAEPPQPTEPPAEPVAASEEEGIEPAGAEEARLAAEPDLASEMEAFEAEEDQVPEWLLEHAEGVSLSDEPAEAEEPAPGPPSAIPEEEAGPTAAREKAPPAADAEAPTQEEITSVAEEPPTPAPPAEETAAMPPPEKPTEPAPPEEAAVPPPPTAEEPTAAPPAAEEPAPAEPTPVEEAAPPQPEEPAPPAAAVEPEIDPALQAARQALHAGDRAAAAQQYDQLIKGRRELEAVIQDLEQALEEDPDVPKLWQTLGDAYMRVNRSKDAVKAYNRGMEETEVLDSARQALAAGDVNRATTQYGILIKHRTELETVIQDLEQAVESGDGQPALWQTLGDAYMKAGRVDDSIKAYRQGMESV